MARLDLNADTSEAFITRINAIRDVSQRQWGSMPPEKLLRHLTLMFEVSLGEREAEKIFVPMPGFLLWILFFNWFTNWPKAKFKGPAAFFPDPEGDLAAEKATCIAGLRRFVETLAASPEQTGYSPLLGHIPLSKWARVHGVHMDHHLRQYGV